MSDYQPHKSEEAANFVAANKSLEAPVTDAVPAQPAEVHQAEIPNEEVQAPSSEAKSGERLTPENILKLVDAVFEKKNTLGELRAAAVLIENNATLYNDSTRFTIDGAKFARQAAIQDTVTRVAVEDIRMAESGEAARAIYDQALGEIEGDNDKARLDILEALQEKIIDAFLQKVLSATTLQDISDVTQDINHAQNMDGDDYALLYTARDAKRGVILNEIATSYVTRIKAATNLEELRAIVQEVAHNSNLTGNEDVIIYAARDEKQGVILNEIATSYVTRINAATNLEELRAIIQEVAKNNNLTGNEDVIIYAARDAKEREFGDQEALELLASLLV